MKKSMLIVITACIYSLSGVLVARGWAQDSTSSANNGQVTGLGHCIFKPLSNWTSAEQQLWLRLCIQAYGHSEPFPKSNGKSSPDCLNRERDLLPVGPNIIKEILTNAGAEADLPPGPLVLRSIRFEGGLNLSGLELNRSITLTDDVLDGEINLEGAKANGDVSFYNSCIFGHVVLRFFHADGSVYFGHGNTDQEMPFPEMQKFPIDSIDATDVVVGHDFVLTNARLKTDLIANGLIAKGSFLVAQSYLTGIRAAAMQIGSQVAIFDDRIKKTVKSSVATPSINLFSTTADTLILARVSSDDDVSASNLNIKSGMYVTDSDISGLDISYSNLGDEFSFVREDGKEHGSIPILARDSKVRVLDAPFQYWAKGSSSIYGFVYADLDDDMFKGGSNIQLPETTIRRYISSWLPAGESFSPEPYIRLENVLENIGYGDISKTIHYREADQDMRESLRDGQYGRGVAQFFYGVFVGYGLEPARSVFWVVFLVILGAKIAKRTPEGKAAGLRYGYTYSFDILLPLIRLREANYKIDIAGPARYYFYFHKIMGYVLSAYVVAAIGLPK